MRFVILLGLLCALTWSQDTTAVLEGVITDPSGAAIKAATVLATNAANGYSRSQETTANGAWHLILPAGQYDLSINASGFASQRICARSRSVLARLYVLMHNCNLQKEPKRWTFQRMLRWSKHPLPSGNVVSGRELVDLPLNGRNFTQLGLLQPGVAPMTQGFRSPAAHCGPARHML